MKKLIERPSFREMADRWPSSIVARKKIGEFTGGAVDPRTMANLDSLGEGVMDRFRIGRQVVYPVSSLLEFLEAKSANV